MAYVPGDIPRGRGAVIGTQRAVYESQQTTGFGTSRDSLAARWTLHADLASSGKLSLGCIVTRFWAVP